MAFPFDLQTLDETRSTDPSEMFKGVAKRKRVWLIANAKCHWCDRLTVMTVNQQSNQATIDHVVPQYKGGTNDISNLVNACYACNQRRNKEDMCGHPEGHLLKKKWSDKPLLTIGDPSKLTIMPPAPPKKVVVYDDQVLRTQRDQAIAEIKRLRDTITRLDNEVPVLRERARIAEERLNGITFLKLAYTKLKSWLDRQEF